VSKRKKSIHCVRNGGAGAALICLFGAAGDARAQSVLMPSQPTYSAVPPAVQEIQNEGEGTLPGALPRFNLPAFSDLVHWGPVTVRPHFIYSASDSTGIQSAPGQSQSSLIQTFSPGVLLNIGTHWSLDYTPSLIYYSSSQFHDTLNQQVTLTWGTVFQDWNFGFSQSYASADDPLVQTGAQTSTSSYSTSLSASYRFNSVMSLDSSLNQAVSDADQFESSKSWSLMEWLNYQFWPQMTGALGAGGGYDLVGTGSDMTHENAQVRLDWRIGNKSTLSVHGGAEDRQFLGGGIPDTITPVYGAALSFQFTPRTSASLSADRSVSPSLFLNQASDNTVLSVSMNQQLLKHFNLSLGGGYNTTHYVAAAGGVVAGRNDDYYTFSAALSWLFLKRATASLSYQYSTDKSSLPGLSFSSSQFGAQLGYAF
jgi:hypothetical protein